MCGVFGGVYVHREVGLRVADSNGAVELKSRRVTRELFSTTVNTEISFSISEIGSAETNPSIPLGTLIHV